MADVSWWRNKLEAKPEYRRFRTHGPLHLELQEKVFRGVIATGYMEYLPEKDGFAGYTETIEETFNTEFGTENGHDRVPGDLGCEPDPSPTPTRVPTGTPTARVSKKKRQSTGSKPSTDEDINNNMMELIDVMKEESMSSIQGVDQNGPIEYDQAIKLLLSLPWVESDTDVFVGLLVLLEDPVKRVAFTNIVHLGEEVLKCWVAASKSKP